LAELSGAISEAVKCHSVDRPASKVVGLHFQYDPELQLAINAGLDCFKQSSFWPRAKTGAILPVDRPAA